MVVRTCPRPRPFSSDEWKFTPAYLPRTGYQDLYSCLLGLMSVEENGNNFFLILVWFDSSARSSGTSIVATWVQIERLLRPYDECVSACVSLVPVSSRLRHTRGTTARARWVTNRTT